MKALIIGADGFIGRHIAFALRSADIHVIASARRTSRLARMGFDVVEADLTDPITHVASFWEPHLTGVDWVINAAGLLTGTAGDFRAVHVSAPAALYEAHSGRALLLSSVGLEAETPFARWRREGETVAMKHGVTVLRAGLVLGDTSYGGSSLARALSSLPLVTPLVDGGEQIINPVHASDLADVMRHILLRPNTGEILTAGGPESLTQASMLAEYRRWMGLPRNTQISVPLGLARQIGRAGDLLRMGPVSATSVEQLATGIEAIPSPDLPAVRPFREFLFARPAGTQDLWHARMYLVRPMIRLTLAAMWLWSGILGLTLTSESFTPLVAPQLPVPTLETIARACGVVNLALGVALLRNWRPRLAGLLQLGVVTAYTLGLSVLGPALWLDPIGGLLKNLPVIALLLTFYALSEER